ncbi:MAG TPA: aldo/keto reductase, partial [Chitinophagaceae bacterium]|nr:aldo/keto reductase [Chitinophagaceae bacterium]
MESVYLSDAGPRVSPAIYGFYRWHEVGRNPADIMERILDVCLELGINTFDHADIYGDYQCEELFGQVMKQRSIPRERLVLFSKCGLRLPHSSVPGVRVPHVDTSSAHIRESVDNSLRRLRTDYID